MSQKLEADYLEGYGDPIPQNDFILVEIRDKKEDLTASGLVKSATADIKPYVVVVKVSDKIQKAEDMEIRPNDIIEIVDVRHLLQFEGPKGEHYSLIDRKNVGAVYHPIEGYQKKKKRVLKTESLSVPEANGLILGANSL